MELKEQITKMLSDKLDALTKDISEKLDDSKSGNGKDTSQAKTQMTELQKTVNELASIVKEIDKEKQEKLQKEQKDKLADELAEMVRKKLEEKGIIKQATEESEEEEEVEEEESVKKEQKEQAEIISILKKAGVDTTNLEIATIGKKKGKVGDDGKFGKSEGDDESEKTYTKEEMEKELEEMEPEERKKALDSWIGGLIKK
jgi:hypothetical protein